MKARILKFEGHVALLDYVDKNSVRHAVVVDISAVPHDAKPGGEIDVSKKVLESGTDYGIDWDIIFPKGIAVRTELLTEALYARGVFSLEDLKQNPQAFHDAMAQVTRSLSKKVLQTVENVLGG